MFYITVSFIIISVIIIILFSNKLKIKDHINKVADMILFYQNNNVKNIENIKSFLEQESKKFRTTLYLPEDMKITEENNEIIIYYRNLMYNINKGKYLDIK